MTSSFSAFQNRREAGRRLARALMHFKRDRPVILALPRGGVPVAYEVAHALAAPLDVRLVRKIGAPGFPELGLGAIVDGKPPQRVLNHALIKRIKPSADYLAAEEARQLVEIERRRTRYCGSGEPMDVRGRTVLVIDDGIATGGTMAAALQALAQEGAAHLVFAAPVASQDAMDILRDAAQEGICLHTPADFRAVGQFYEDFEQTTDEEVISLLNQSARDYAEHAIQEESMQSISEIMTPDVTVVSPDDNLQQAAKLMKDWDVGAIPVCNGKRLVGMLTDRDITIRAVADGKSPVEVRVADVMSDQVLWCFEDQSIGEVLQQMSDKQIRRIPVISRNMELVGVVSIGDLATRYDIDTDDALEQISSPSSPTRPSMNQTRHH